MKKRKKIFLFLLIVEIGFLFGWWFKARQDIYRLDKKVQKMRGEIQQLEEENKKLQEIVEKKINEPFFREKLARERLGLAQEGEVVYRIVPRENLPLSE